MFKQSVLCGLFAGLFPFSGLSVVNVQAQPANWTGFYAGVHAGNASMTNEWKNADGDLSGFYPFEGAFTSGGLIGGFQFGYNYQVNRTVLGIEVDAAFGDIEGSARCGIGFYVCDAKIDALGTITLRLGYAYGDLLVFGKAGAAWAHEKLNLAPTPGYGLTGTGIGNVWRWGWTVGAGLEYAFTSALSAKAEYNFIEFNNGKLGLTGLGSSNVAIEQQIHLVKLGLNYKLGEKTPFEHPLGRPGELPAWNWTGFYGGLHVGGGWGMTDWKSADGALDAISTFAFPGAGQANGSIVGGQIGFNRQVGAWVAGGEISASWSNLDGFARCATSAAVFSYVCHTRIEALALATGRLGHTFGNLLVYGLAGFAVAKVKHDAYEVFVADQFSGGTIRTGYALGSGLEYALTPAWSAKFEYNFVDFGSKSIALTDGAGNVSNVSIGQQLQLFKMGMNYKFGVDPYAPGHSAFASALIGKKPITSSGWVIEAGLRYAFSNGKSQQDLYSNSGPTDLVSRLIYGDMNGHSAEAFLRFDHDGGAFLKGNFGLGSLVNGMLHDEDMPPVTSPYSNTIHTMKDGALRYGSLDIGYNLLNGPAGKFGPYVGYRYFHQLGRGYGCEQVAVAGGICAAGGPPSYQAALTETESWRGGAIGMNTQMALSPRWTLEVDAAYLPYVDRAGVDNHWARAGINPGPETGNGWGTQVEAILTYAVNERLSVGLGGRYWYFTTNSASAIFPLSEPSPIIFTSERYGGFLQASYKIGDAPSLARADSEPAAVVDWTGFYVGGHLGAGKGRDDWSDSFPAPVTGDRVATGGALSGAQIGFNKQFGKIVLGAELSVSAARIVGSETCFGGIVPATNAGLNCDNRIGPVAALTGRIGYAFERSLVYAIAGGVVAREKYTLNSKAIAGGTISSRETTNWGWTAGAGVEHALDARWSVNLEYEYVDFGSRTVPFDVPAVINEASLTPIRTHAHLFSLGVNYHFEPMSR